MSTLTAILDFIFVFQSEFQELNCIDWVQWPSRWEKYGVGMVEDSFLKTGLQQLTPILLFEFDHFISLDMYAFDVY